MTVKPLAEDLDQRNTYCLSPSELHSVEMINNSLDEKITNHDDVTKDADGGGVIVTEMSTHRHS